ncbi:hypothetical protein [Paraburkholderia strydomiana]|uniref:hypothetical protein n=1 Tax=Paraburkholderia strydomiana TaxID=1245417 RepID=UPI001BE775B9|nr:hypothetical protein [Paraburkholderia strydomiana]MBT2794759.1 hypothetical protein [Paraburkholderia strydomiana]
MELTAVNIRDGLAIAGGIVLTPSAGVQFPGMQGSGRRTPPNVQDRFDRRTFPASSSARHATLAFAPALNFLFH